MGWIKLEDKNPEPNMLVVINFIDNEKIVARYVKNVSGDYVFFTKLGEARREKITYWIEIEELKILKPV